MHLRYRQSSTMLLATWLISDILAISSVIIAGWYIYYKLHIFKFWQKRGVFYVEPTFPTGNIMPIVIGKRSQGKIIVNKYKTNVNNFTLKFDSANREKCWY